MTHGIAQQGRYGGFAQVYAENLMPLGEQAQTKVRADETRTAQNDDSFLHLYLLFIGIERKIRSNSGVPRGGIAAGAPRGAEAADYSWKSALGSSAMLLIAMISILFGRLTLLPR